jgi:hypothetical protein
MSYGTVAGWITYAAARGVTVADTAASAAALQRAADYIRYHYVAQFLPPHDETAPEVEPATYEAAAYELAEPGFFAKTYTPAQQKVLTGVEGIRWTVTGSTDSADAWANAAPTVTKVAAMLDPYMPGKYRVGVRALG